MTDYTKTTNFTAKDSLPTGTAAKKVLGSELDTEFDNIETHLATKLDASTWNTATFEEVETINLSGGGTSTGICLFSTTPADNYAYVIVLNGVSTDTASSFQGLELSAAATWRTTNEYSYVNGALTTTAVSGSSTPYIPLLYYSGYTGEAAATKTSGQIWLYGLADSGVQTAVQCQLTTYSGASIGHFYSSGIHTGSEVQDAFRLRLYTNITGSTDGRDYDAGTVHLYRVAEP